MIKQEQTTVQDINNIFTKVNQKEIDRHTKVLKQFGQNMKNLLTKHQETFDENIELLEKLKQFNKNFN